MGGSRPGRCWQGGQHGEGTEAGRTWPVGSTSRSSVVGESEGRPGGWGSFEGEETQEQPGDLTKTKQGGLFFLHSLKSFLYSFKEKKSFFIV